MEEQEEENEEEEEEEMEEEIEEEVEDDEEEEEKYSQYRRQRRFWHNWRRRRQRQHYWPSNELSYQIPTVSATIRLENSAPSPHYYNWPPPTPIYYQQHSTQPTNLQQWQHPSWQQNFVSQPPNPWNPNTNSPAIRGYLRQGPRKWFEINRRARNQPIFKSTVPLYFSNSYYRNYPSPQVARENYISLPPHYWPKYYDSLNVRQKRKNWRGNSRSKPLYSKWSSPTGRREESFEHSPSAPPLVSPYQQNKQIPNNRANRQKPPHPPKQQPTANSPSSNEFSLHKSLHRTLLLLAAAIFCITFGGFCVLLMVLGLRAANI